MWARTGVRTLSRLAPSMRRPLHVLIDGADQGPHSGRHVYDRVRLDGR